MLNHRTSLAAAAVAGLIAAASHGVGAQIGQDRRDGGSGRLTATAHPPLPSRPSLYWLVPETAASVTGAAGRPAEAAAERFARGVRAIDAGQFTVGLPLVSNPDLATTPLAAYALYYTSLAHAGLSRYADAQSALTALSARKPDGFLKEAGALKAADLALVRLDNKRAVDILDDLTSETLTAPEEAWLQLGRAAERAGDSEKALRAYRRVYYDFPLSAQSGDAQSGIDRLQARESAPFDILKHEIARGERLFAARRWAQARATFQPLMRVQGETGQLASLRVAECDYYLDRFQAARDGVLPFVKGGAREAEARFFYLTALRALGERQTYVTLARELVDDFPESSWSEETLNNLASHYIIVDEDEQADRVFRELARRFPRSRHAERAAWKIGWRAYRSGDFQQAAEVFEQAAATFPRADYRPAWLYWSARSRDKTGETAVATGRYRLVVVDYQNSYYGRLADAILTERREPPVAPNAPDPAQARSADSVPTAALIRQLLSLELYDQALREVQYAQRAWGDSPQLQATIAWIRHNQGLTLTATERFNALRGAINTMRRAYPQFMAAGGEALPADVLRIIFPIDYWPLIRKYTTTHGLDPYLVTALMAQESTFTPEIKSPANAYGLMQVIPGTGSRYARRMGIRPFSIASLTNPETNVRIGTQYFKDLVDRFGGAHFALASYNAGESRVAEWRAEKPDLAQDEFIDDIPFPETQTYVKRILGTAEDYRRLYGGGLLDPNTRLLAPSRASAAAASPRTAPRTAAAKPATRRATRRPAAKAPSRRAAAPTTRPARR